MNTEHKQRLQRVADWLHAGAPHVQLNENVSLDEFDYGEWVSVNPKNTCGTVACIAGALMEFEYADELEIRPSKRAGFLGHINIAELMKGELSDEARRLLDITDEEASLLFYPFDMDAEDVPTHLIESHDDENEPLNWVAGMPPKEIGKVVQHFIDTGEIKWLMIKPEPDALT